MALPHCRVAVSGRVPARGWPAVAGGASRQVDKWVIGTYPLLNNKPALIRAFHRTTKHDGDGDDFVEPPACVARGASGVARGDARRRRGS